MSLVTSFITGQTSEALASALVHFLWQGALLSVAAWAVMRWLAGSASARYGIGIVTLAAMLAVPVTTFVATLDDTAGAAAARAVAAEGSTPAAAFVNGSEMPTTLRLPPFVTLFWIAGVIVLSVRLAGGWVVARRLASKTVRGVDAGIAQLAARMAERLGVRTAVRLAESSAVAVPMVIGWLRPVVLVPAAALSGLTSAQLEALLAHELAHVRRHDYFVNLLQSVVETLLFYHPAVWWLSARVREEREHCCDDLAVSVCDRVVYVDALTMLAAIDRGPVLALAATDGSLLRRVRRLLDGSSDRPRAAGGWPAMVIAGAIVAVLLPSGEMSGQPADDEQATRLAAQAATARDAAAAARAAVRERSAEVARAAAAAEPATTNVASASARQADRAKLLRAQLLDAEKQLAQITRQRRALEVRQIAEDLDAQARAKRAELEAFEEQVREREELRSSEPAPGLAAELRVRRAALERELDMIEARKRFEVQNHELETAEAEHRALLERLSAAYSALEAGRDAATYSLQEPPPPAPAPRPPSTRRVRPLAPPPPPPPAEAADAPLAPAAPPPPSTRRDRPLPPPPPPPPAAAAADAPPPPPPPPPPDFNRLREVSDGRALILPNDVLVATVESNNEPLRVITERGNGSITLPRIGSMRLQGMTVAAARQSISAALAATNGDLVARLWVYREGR